MSEWKSVTLGQLSKDKQIEIRTGPFGSQLHQSDYIADGIPVVMPKDIVDWNICTDTIARTSSEMAEKLRIHRLRSGDIVYGRRGDIGRHAFVTAGETGWLCGTGCIRLRLLSDAPIIPRFLSFYLRLPDTISSIYNQAVGATMPNLNTSIIENVTVIYPHISTQKKIVSALATYDTLIENNNRRIAILEEMAQKLYCEWFVHFRFPGHENVKMVESEMGMIPEGWKVKKAGSVLTTQYGYTETAQDMPTGSKYLRGTDINKRSYIDWDSVPYCPIDNNRKERYALNIGDVLIIRMADPGKIGIVEEKIDAVFASYLIRLAPINRVLSPYYLFYMAKDSAFQGFVLGASTGSTRKSISAETIKEAPILIPHTSVLDNFEERITSYRQAIVNLTAKNTNLRKTRDLLLPRLISGDIDVSELDIPIKEG